ncbi:MAG: glycosyltransferase family 2 protein [Patescibacteria group bacterium]
MISAITFIYWPEEVEVLENCLKSLAFCDEIIVIDNGAPETVVKIAQKYTDKIFKSADSSFAARHNLGKEKAKGDWILYIDSDERVSQKLAQEIKNIDDSFDAYQLSRVNYFLGKAVKYGDRVPDFVTRLFRKDKLKNWIGEIHESSEVSGKIGQLKAPIYHLTHRGIFSMVKKTINFSEREVDIRLAINHPPVVWWRLIRVFVTEAFNRIIKMQGWRQGTEGWIDGLLQAFSLFIVYARLWEKQRKTPLSKTYQEIDERILNGEL